jgi:hypothetical protein
VVAEAERNRLDPVVSVPRQVVGRKPADGGDCLGDRSCVERPVAGRAQGAGDLRVRERIAQLEARRGVAVQLGMRRTPQRRRPGRDDDPGLDGQDGRLQGRLQPQP